ncbi:hypothetical protein RHGRI_025796 [Rhododendron griersonianum]|uniref:Uncharacterized protein n=1 Tax=Rhododendron griersonianum TaxID=479676 RepID=A0AAV6IQI7_9ERIC|nr:hypothetical protein RHGRI_025796 [Rhododendron griersonianum]
MSNPELKPLDRFFKWLMLAFMAKGTNPSQPQKDAPVRVPTGTLKLRVRKMTIQPTTTQTSLQASQAGNWQNQSGQRPNHINKGKALVLNFWRDMIVGNFRTLT